MPGARPLKGSLLDSLKLIQPSIPGFMLSAGNLARIDQIASLLPAIHRVGFEYLFGSGNGGLDFQQGIALNVQETSRLLNTAPSGSIISEEFSVFPLPVIAFISGISHPTHRDHSYFKQIWLEFDCGILGKNYLKASIFLALNYKNTDLGLASDAVCHAYELLSGNPVDEATQAMQLRVFQNAESSGITHVGFMLGRDQAVMRLVIPLTNANTLKFMLNCVGWKGDVEQSVGYWRWLAGLFPEIRMCIDISDGIAPQLGFECFFKSQQQNDSGDTHLTRLFAALVAKNLCDASEVSFMENWPGCVYPHDVAFDWPDDITLRSLSGPENSFLMLERRLSHIKLSGIEKSKPAAKVYFGYFEKLYNSR